MLARIIRLVVLFFAVYGFVFVRLGEKTALEHVVAIVRTPEAQQAVGEVKTSAGRLVGELRGAAKTAARAAASSSDPDAPKSDSPAPASPPTKH
jgi:hypothetical protein